MTFPILLMIMANEMEKMVEKIAGCVFDQRKDEVIREVRKIFDQGFEKDMHYEPWSALEDELLFEEFTNAVKKIAERHRRSFGAILSRIRQKDFLDKRIYK